MPAFGVVPTAAMYARCAQILPELWGSQNLTELIERILHWAAMHAL
jgi:hypothetical protein